MGHRTSRCDYLDVLEEAAVFHRRVEVALRSGLVFADRVRDVVTEDGEDYAIFAAHERTPITEIAECWRAGEGSSA
jgi:transcriptional antiterminator Rof (Rho-off)